MRSKAPFLTALWILVLLSPFAIPVTLWQWHFDFAAFIAFAFATQVSACLALIFTNWRRRILQSRIRSLAWKEHKPFVLISRSFEQHKEFTTNVPIPESGILKNHISLIGAVIYDLSHKHPLVVLGDKDLDRNSPANDALYLRAWETLPKDRVIWVVSDDLAIDVVRWAASWEHIFTDLAKAARYVLVIPAKTEGFLREIEILKAEKLGPKTIVYMWPQCDSIPNAAICASSSAWEALRIPLADRGLVLPGHRREGALLRLDEEFTIGPILEPITGKNIFTPLQTDINNASPLRRIAPLIASYEVTSNPKLYTSMWRFWGAGHSGS